MVSGAVAFGRERQRRTIWPAPHHLEVAFLLAHAKPHGELRDLELALCVGRLGGKLAV
jgi:hypothetical protein